MSKLKYTLTENAINGIILKDEIREEDLHEYHIVNRDSLIDELIIWITEATKNKDVMKDDLRELMSWNYEYILSSNMINSYLGEDSIGFDDACKELLELNND